MEPKLLDFAGSFTMISSPSTWILSNPRPAPHLEQLDDSHSISGCPSPSPMLKAFANAAHVLTPLRDLSFGAAHQRIETHCIILPYPFRTGDDMAEPTYEELKAKLAELEKQGGGRRSGALEFRVGEKGGVSVYGLGRFPVTLYYEQWIRLLEAVPQLRTFLEENKSQGKLKLKER
jgi:hypothetical protein